MHRNFLKHYTKRKCDVSISRTLVCTAYYLIGFMVLISLSFCAQAPHISADTPFTFSRFYIDVNYGPGPAGIVAAGDMDGDGDLDIVAAGGNAIHIYENDGNSAEKNWKRYGNLDSTGQIGLDGISLYDVDGNGDLDLIGAKFNGNLGWWKNPGGQLSSTPWTFHKLADASWFLHDIIRVDLDQDSISEEFVTTLNSTYWNGSIKIAWFRPGADPTQLWESHLIESGRNEGPSHGHAGLDVGDVDQDGNVDLAFSNGWYEAPDDPADTWTWRQITDIYGISNALLRDMDNDGDLDLIMSAGHHGKGVYWFANPADPKDSSWVQNTIDSEIVHPECLAVLDLDNDGDLDIVSCDIDFDNFEHEVHNLYILENLGGNSTSWNKHNIASSSHNNHLLQMVDINQDGQMDIISESAGHSIINYYEYTFSEPGVWLPLMLKPNTPF